MTEKASTEVFPFDFEFDSLATANNYRKAIIQQFTPHIRGDVLEVGAGIGQITQAILSLGKARSVTCVEPTSSFYTGFQKNCPGIRLIQGTTQDLPATETYDCAVMVNVLEHIRNDVEELQKLHDLLKPSQGHLCLLVPARKELFSKLDVKFGHFRRYHPKGLGDKMVKAGFQNLTIYYFNCIGYFAWLFRFRLLGSSRFNITQVRLFDRWIFPFFYLIESKVFRPPIGQSLIAIGRAS